MRQISYTKKKVCQYIPDNELNDLQPCGSVRRVPTRIAVILGKRSLYDCSASRIMVPSPLGLPIGFLSLEFKSIEDGSTLSM